jgi:hypothetical protein
MIALVSTSLVFASSFSSLAISTRQTEPTLEVKITIAQTQATVGAPMTWLVTLTPLGKELHSVELQSGDTQVWQWINGPVVVGILTDTAVMDVSAVPLVSGDLTPILKVHYTVGKEPQTHLVEGSSPLEVRPVETYVEAGILAQKGTARKGEPLSMEVWIRNSSPFTLAGVQMYGAGTDLGWDVLPDAFDVPPTMTLNKKVAPKVTGQHPQPQLRIEYEWTDAAGNDHKRMLYVGGEPVALEEGVIESILGRIPNEVFGIIIGLIAGALTGFVGNWVSRILQRRTNWQHLQGLLRMMILQAEQASNSGVPLDLAPLKTVFENEGLFTMAEKKRLAQCVRDLWKAAERHNNGLGQPGGAQRTGELRKAEEELEKKLDLLKTT